MSANANQISPTRGVLPGLSEERLPLSSPSTVAEAPAQKGGQSPDKVVTHWRRFSSGLWRVPEGDISAAYSAESFPKIKVFTHEGKLFTNGGGHFSGPVAAGADLERGDLITIREQGRRTKHTARLIDVRWWMVRCEADKALMEKLRERKASKAARLAACRQRAAERRLFRSVPPDAAL